MGDASVDGVEVMFMDAIVAYYAFDVNAKIDMKSAATHPGHPRFPEKIREAQRAPSTLGGFVRPVFSMDVPYKRVSEMSSGDGPVTVSYSPGLIRGREQQTLKTLQLLFHRLSLRSSPFRYFEKEAERLLWRDESMW